MNSARGDILEAFADAIEAAGEDGAAMFSTVRIAYTRALANASLPAVIVSVAGEEIDQNRVARGWAVRELMVDVRVVMKHREELGLAMEVYAEAVEQAVLYDDTLRGLVMSVLPAAYVPPEVDLAGESPVAVSVVKFRVTYNSWVHDPDDTENGGPIEDPYKPDPDGGNDPEDPGGE